MNNIESIINDQMYHSVFSHLKRYQQNLVEESERIENFTTKLLSDKRTGKVRITRFLLEKNGIHLSIKDFKEKNSLITFNYVKILKENKNRIVFKLTPFGKMMLSTESNDTIIILPTFKEKISKKFTGYKYKIKSIDKSLQMIVTGGIVVSLIIIFQIIVLLLGLNN